LVFRINSSETINLPPEVRRSLDLFSNYFSENWSKPPSFSLHKYRTGDGWLSFCSMTLNKQWRCHFNFLRQKLKVNQFRFIDTNEFEFEIENWVFELKSFNKSLERLKSKVKSCLFIKLKDQSINSGLFELIKCKEVFEVRQHKENSFVRQRKLFRVSFAWEIILRNFANDLFVSYFQIRLKFGFLNVCFHSLDFFPLSRRDWKTWGLSMPNILAKGFNFRQAIFQRD